MKTFLLRRAAVRLSAVTFVVAAVSTVALNPLRAGATEAAQPETTL
jgi:hypothetical protein